METSVHTYSDVTAHACHEVPPCNLVHMAFVALYSLVYDSNQTGTKCGAIEEVNQK